jgi:hypothetical protein
MCLPTKDEDGRTSLNRSTAMISRSGLHRCLILALLLSFYCECHAAWIPATSVVTARSTTTRTPSPSTKQLYSNQSNDNDEKGDEEMKKESFDLDKFLDTPFFEPDKVLKDENSNPVLKNSPPLCWEITNLPKLYLPEYFL